MEKEENKNVTPENTAENNPNLSTHGQQELPNSTAVLILGICSIVLGCGFIGLALGIVGVIMSKKGRQLNKENPLLYSDYSKLKAGYIMSIIGIIISVLALIYFIFVVLILGAGFFTAISAAAANGGATGVGF